MATSKAYSTDQIGPQVSISGRRDVRHLLEQPDTAPEHDVPGREQRVAPRRAHALRAGIDFLFNDDTITFLRTFRGSYTFSSLATFLAGNYNGYAQTFGDPVINQRTRTSASTYRTNGARVRG